MAQTIEGLIRGETRQQTEERQRARERAPSVSLAQIRKQHPEYDDMTDEDLARGLHRKFYNDMPFADFAQRIQLGRPSRPNQRVSTDQPRNLYDEVSGFASQVRASLPGSDELQGAIRGFGGAVEGFVNPSSGGVSVLDTTKDGVSLQERLQGAQGGYQREYGKEVERERDQRDDFAARRPLTSIAAQLPANAMINDVATRAAGTGGNLAVRAVKGAVAGGVVGGAYGAASEGNLEERGQNALMGAGTGAAFGGAFPVAGRMISQRANVLATPAAVAVNSALGGAGGYYAADLMGMDDETKAQWAGYGALGLGGVTAAAPAVRAARPAFNALMADRSGSVPRAAGAPPSGGSTVRGEVDESLQRMAARARLTPDKLDEIAAQAEATGRNPMTAHVMGEPGLTRLQANARSPGQSGERVAETVRASRQQQAARLATDMDEVLPKASVRQAEGQLADEFENASKSLYQPVLAGEVNMPAMPAVQQVMRRFPPEVVKRAEGVMARLARMEGTDPARLTQAQKLHFMKRALDDTIGSMRREGLGNDEFRAMVGLKRDLLKAMDEAIPGYGSARQTWGGIAEAKEALEEGRNFLSMRTDELTDYASGLTDAQRRYFEIGIRDRMEQLVSDVGSAPTRTNLAGRLEAGRVQERLRAVLGDRAEGFLQRVGAESQTFRDQSRVLPSVNSPTSNVLADLIDQTASMPTPRNALTGGLDMIYRKLTNPLFEAKRNKETERLLQELTPAQIRALRKAIQDNVLRRKKLTNDAVSNAAAGAAFSDN